ncbi:RNase HII [Chitinophaga costaii]|uniref:Ribonuclease HII n=1 Tax=Chitinophaga costaii TaxID=1335309 RepID=A0A1C4AAF5_9BACT|nr:ribonuclease HII [Chitinophaga costaii]PUZ26522.1 ribonuclease HII [Chitinophaga costaii]SCB91460.1 RNase HII [Chitinophaga costaii]
MLKSYYQKGVIEAGCDEAGRGCLAGPVFAAAVILPPRFKHPLLNDSKQMKPAHREEVRQVIEAKAICYAVASVDNEEIDRINILKASFKAMHLALDKLQQQPALVLVDGNRFTPYRNVPHACIIRGDGLYTAIAAASVLAKTYRDAYMQALHLEHPQFGWHENKGYGTLVHRNALREHGETRYHRKSFRLNYDQPELDFEINDTGM